jgi:hypothetical protein
MSFQNQVQQWILIDNQLKILNDKVKELREKRSSATDNLINYASANNLSSSVIQISDGKLKFANTKVTEPLTFKYVEKTLGEVIKNESQVKLIMEHLKNKRETKIVSEIKRVSNN